jgi:hypothetical protein
LGAWAGLFFNAPPLAFSEEMQLSCRGEELTLITEFTTYLQQCPSLAAPHNDEVKIYKW